MQTQDDDIFTQTDGMLAFNVLKSELGLKKKISQDIEHYTEINSGSVGYYFGYAYFFSIV